MIGALATVLTGVLNEQEALASMRWQVIFLVHWQPGDGQGVGCNGSRKSDW